MRFIKNGCPVQIERLRRKCGIMQSLRWKALERRYGVLSENCPVDCKEIFKQPEVKKEMTEMIERKSRASVLQKLQEKQE